MQIVSATPPVTRERPIPVEIAAGVLLAATVVLHVVAMFPTYFVGQAPLASQTDQAALYAVVAAAWALALGVGASGPDRTQGAAAIAVGVALTEFGFRLSDLGDAINFGTKSAGAGLWVMTAAWVVGAAAAAVCVLAAMSRHRSDRPLLGHGTPGNQVTRSATGEADQAFVVQPLGAQFDGAQTFTEPAGADSQAIADNPYADMAGSTIGNSGVAVRSAWAASDVADAGDVEPVEGFAPVSDTASVPVVDTASVPVVDTSSVVGVAQGSDVEGGLGINNDAFDDGELEAEAAWVPTGAAQGSGSQQPTPADSESAGVSPTKRRRRFRSDVAESPEEAHERNLWTLLVFVLAVIVAGGFLPAWDRGTATSSVTGQQVVRNLGNAFSGPWQQVVGIVIVAVALLVVPVAAVRIRNKGVGAALAAGGIVILTSQLVAAVVQVNLPVPPADFGLSASQVSQLGLVLTIKLTAWFVVDAIAAYLLFAAVIIRATLREVPQSSLVQIPGSGAGPWAPQWHPLSAPWGPQPGGPAPVPGPGAPWSPQPPPYQ